MKQKKLNPSAPVWIKSEHSKALDDILQSPRLELQDTVDKEYQLLLVNPHSRVVEYELQTCGAEKVEFYGFADELLILKVINMISGKVVDIVGIYNEPFSITADDPDFRQYYRQLAKSRDLTGVEVFGHN